jgi:hypothetical protein
MTTVSPQVGHSARVPANSSRAFSFRPQTQVTEIGMVVARGNGRRDRQHTDEGEKCARNITREASKVAITLRVMSG